MANGQALQVLIKAHEMTQDLSYLIAAKSLLNAFYRIKDGGITYKDSQMIGGMRNMLQMTKI